MKHAALIPLVAAAATTAFVIPDEATARELVVETERKAGATLSSWWDRVPNPEDVRSGAKDAFDGAYDTVAHKTGLFGSHLQEAGSEVVDFLFSPSPFDNGHAEGGKPGHGHRSPVENLTIYEAIHSSDNTHTKRFAALVDEFPELVDLLNGTTSDSNVTLFVPTDAAFEKIPKHGDKKPPKEFLEKLVKYHIVPGLWPAGRVFAHHTIPTALELEQLGNRPQRLRVSVGLFGLRINYFGKLVAPNVEAKNGVIHGLDSILVPPPDAGDLIALFPTKFSTLLLAAEKTGLHDDAKRHTDHKLTGLTVFAPTNTAFKKLGPAANAFLFNSEKGLRYLKALLLYHVVANETLYSDHYYGPPSSEANLGLGLGEFDDGDGDGVVDVEDGGPYAGAGDTKDGHTHIDLPSLLHGKHLSVDVSRWHRLITIRVNGRTRVSVQDAIAGDGVVQVVDSVLFPPHKPKDGGSSPVSEEEAEDGEISVEELIERLQPLVDGEAEDEWVGEL